MPSHCPPPPALDYGHTILDFIDYHGRTAAPHPLFTFCTDPCASDAAPTVITAAQFAAAVFKVAQDVARALPRTPPPSPSGRHVVAVLANLNSIVYFALAMGIVHAGATPLLLSTRNAPEATAQLLQRGGAATLVLSEDEPLQMLAAAALDELEPLGHDVTRVLPAPGFAELFVDQRRHPAPPTSPVCRADALEETAMIMHSSGSTSTPKLIYITHRTMIEWCMDAAIGGDDLTKHTLAIPSLPIFHGMGMVCLVNAVATGLCISVFPPQTPPLIPTSDNTLEHALATRSSLIFVVPDFLERWADLPDTLDQLRRFTGIYFGGAPLSKTVGDRLAAEGIPLVSGYGAIEVGVGSLFLSPSRFLAPTEWEWITVAQHANPNFVGDAVDATQFELVYEEGPTHVPAVLNTVVEGVRGYATNDIVVRHASDPRRFKVVGRKDDQLTLSTGEKTNPGPLEDIIRQSPLVDIAIMFGRGRAQHGVLIQLVPGEEVDPTDEDAVARIRDRLWPAVENANATAHAHSRLFKEMILLADPRKPFAVTPKRTPRRGRILLDYADEIEVGYAAYERALEAHLRPPAWHDADDVRRFVREVVTHTMRGKGALEDTDDIFARGADSLNATWIRNTIATALRQREGAPRVSQSLVYLYPSIAALAKALVLIVRKAHSAESARSEEALTALVAKYTQGFAVHRPSSPFAPDAAAGAEVVLLTGSTGGLGCQLLALLAERAEVSRVYALNRRAATALPARQRAAFVRRGLDPDLLDEGKIKLVEGDLVDGDLGISPALLDEIRNSTTLIIHNAWNVNFNLKVDAFEPLVAGVRHIVDLSLSSPLPQPPRVIFTSSVGVYSKWMTADAPRERPITIPELVTGSGYASSKWVGERILEEAAAQTPLRPVIVRVGQISGNAHGAWNSTDWLPALVRSGQVLGCLPTRDDPVSWMSSELAAAALYDFRNSESQHLHLVHPAPASWSSLFASFAADLAVPLVPWPAWLAKLEAAAESGGADPRENPAQLLVDFFRHCSPVPAKGREALGMPALDMTEARKASPALSTPAPLGRTDAQRWVRYWRAEGLLTA